MSDTFAVIGRSFVLLANVAVMLVAIPAVVRIAGVVLTPLSPVFALVSALGIVASAIGGLLAYAVLFQLTMQDLHGQTPSTEALFSVAFSKFLPMLGLAILLGFGVTLGTMLLIVPGIILATAWSVAMPALVLENRGVFGAFKRSAELTRHKRWSIFLLFFLVFLIFAVVDVVLLALFGGFHGLVSRGPSITNTVLSSLLSVITIPFGAVLYAALFNRLRGNEGYGAEAVAEVFA
ncbi:MAG TPA: glycerophosphoryl diester phosphodiesterase membrane domain-containing protein [Caulobacteraceae bacterium]